MGNLCGARWAFGKNTRPLKDIAKIFAYLAAVKPDATLVAEGRQVKQGRRAGFYEIAVMTEDGTPVANVHCVAHRVAS